jgi:hypothetical protein
MTKRLLPVSVSAIGAAVGTAVTAFATGAEPPATATVCIKPNGQIRAVTPESPACVEPEKATEWTVNGVKAITPGAGLVGREAGGIVSLGVDPDLIENANSGKIHAGFSDGPHSIPGTGGGGLLADIAQLALPAGAFAISAKLTVVQDDDFRTWIRCRLEAGADFDESRVDVEANGSAAMALAVVHRFSEPGLVEVRCGTAETGGYENLKVIAVEGSSLSNTDITPPWLRP